MDSQETVNEKSDANALIQAVDEELAMLGENAKIIVYRKLERDFAIKTRDIPMKFKEFSGALQEVLGPGAVILVRFIVNKYYRKVGKQTPLSVDPSEIAQSFAVHRKEEFREFVRPGPIREVTLKSVPTLKAIREEVVTG